MDEDYYNILGISRSAAAAEIQKAYRNLARKYHPDMNPNDKTAKEKFQKVQRAFEVLNDPKKREMYDRYGSSFESIGQGRPPGGTHTWTGQAPGGFEDLDLSQFFAEKYGGGEGSGGDAGNPFAGLFKHFTSGGAAETGAKGARSPRQGQDIHAEATIPLGTSVTGGEVELTLQRKAGKTESIKVKIPVGIEDGKKIRLRGQGEAAGRRGVPGDLILTVHVAPHPCYTRRGNHLDVAVPVTLAEAARGAKIDVPTPGGVVKLTVPPATSSGTKLRLKGLGVAPKGQTPGDVYAEIQIMLPDRLDGASLELIEKLAALGPTDPRRDLRW